MIADPYTRLLVARDQVNQAAAVLIASTEAAQELGIDPQKWVYLHGYSKVKEREIMSREDLGASPAARLACREALAAARVSIDEIALFDLYSCFPIAVFNICDGLGLSPQDPRGLTVTGGLPYFGGPGNSYSTHAIASMVEKLRERKRRVRAGRRERRTHVEVRGRHLFDAAGAVQSAATAVRCSRRWIHGPRRPSRAKRTVRRRSRATPSCTARADRRTPS